MNNDTVTISMKEYKELTEASAILDALYAAGVDNWEWYGDALDAMEDKDD